MSTTYQGSIPLTITYVNHQAVEEFFEELSQIDWTPPPPICKKPKPVFARPAKLRFNHPRPLINLATGQTIGYTKPSFLSMLAATVEEQ